MSSSPLPAAGASGAPATPPPHWDAVIRPTRPWYALPFRELWRYRDLLALFVWRDFVAVYKQTILGPAWYLLQAFLTSATFTVVFNRVAGLSTDSVPPFLFYMAGTVLWGYFSDCFIKTSATFTANANIFGKVYFPRIIVPVSGAISNLISMGIQLAVFAVLTILAAARGAPIRPTPALLLLPLLVAMLAAIGLGAGLAVAALTTRYRDLQHAVRFGVQLLMFVTPVILPVSAIPAAYRPLALLNPLAPVFETFRYACFGLGHFQPLWLLLGGAGALGWLGLGLLLFNRVERTFTDTI